MTKQHNGASEPTGKLLEIGPGASPLPGFITVDIDPARKPDYLADAAQRLPFADNTFSLVFASHVLEHLPWYQSLDVLREWVRVLQPGGALEIWVPDGLRICQALVATEEKGSVEGMRQDGWFRYNPAHDPYLWANGRIYTYGDGRGTTDHPNWHRALFTPRHLQSCLQQAGLRQIRRLSGAERRGRGHGWIELGAIGYKASA